MIQEHPIYRNFGADENGNLYSKYGNTPGGISKVSNEWSIRKLHTDSNGRKSARLSQYKKNIRLHRFTWECFKGVIPDGLEIDHIDRNPSNNTLNNLRLANSAEQKRNCGKKTWRGKHSSKYKGVYYDKSRQLYECSIKVNKKKKFLGYFKEEIDAAKRYDEEAIKYSSVTNKELGLI